MLAYLRIATLHSIGMLLIISLGISAISQSAFAFAPFEPYFQNSSNDKSTADKQLSSVKKDIASQQTEIVEVSKKRLELNKQLKRDDLAISTVAKAIKETDALLVNIKNKLFALAKEEKILQDEKKAQEAILAKQLRTAYSSGNHDYLKLLLNQEAAAKVERTLTYYQYLNKARIEEIDQFKVTLAAIQAVEKEQKIQAEELVKQKAEQAEQQESYEKIKQQRSQTIVSLKKELLTKQQQLAKLKSEERDLVRALKRLEALSKKDSALVGLSKLQKQLAWPVKGKIKHSFGKTKQGYLRWKGVVLSAEVGSQVNSIENGTVLFADWLKGYGLVTVIDHGDGYMSLYGQNQALLKNVGETVERGEPIALVGESGGQDEPGLYFEIRHRGKPVNPKTWCK